MSEKQHFAIPASSLMGCENTSDLNGAQVSGPAPTAGLWLTLRKKSGQFQVKMSAKKWSFFFPSTKVHRSPTFYLRNPG